MNELVKDGRAQLSVISSKVKLSIPAVSERIKKLEKFGYIERYSTILDPNKFNKKLVCFSSVTLKYDKEKLKEFESFVVGEDEIMSCHLITGEYEYLLKIVTEDPASLGSLLIRLRENADVLASSTSISIATLKDNASITPSFRNFIL